MTIDRIRKVVQAEPFQPFILSLADGRRFLVRSPGFIFITPEASRTIIVAESGEDYSIIDLLMVTSIDVGNGRKCRSNGKAPRH